MLAVNSADFLRARKLCQSACKKHPSSAELWFLLGAIHGQLGDFKQAEICCQRVVELQPGVASGHYNLAVAQRNLGKLGLSEKSLSRVLELDPGFVTGWFDMGHLHASRENHDAAIACFDKVLALSPQAFQACLAKAAVVEKLGRHLEAIDLLLKSLSINSAQPDVILKLGGLYELNSEYSKAGELYRKVISSDVKNIAAINALALLYNTTMQFGKALSTIRMIVDTGYESKETIYNYALILASNRKYKEAIEQYTRVLDIDPGFTRALVNLGNILLLSARPDEARALYLKAYKLEPDYLDAASNMLMSLNYTNTVTKNDVYRLHVDRSRRLELAVTQRQQHSYSHEVLRIGYVSPDLRSHSVAYFFEAILKYSNNLSVVNYCYSSTNKKDAVSEFIESACDNWRDVYSYTDEALADQIEKDEIDILVDLSGYTSGNRLGMFAMKSAPIQITYLGYPNTTGLTTVDYRIVDAITDPAEITDFMAEKPIYMEPSFLCYSPPVNCPSVSELPALSNGYITFGSFNNLAKMTEEVIELWALILSRVTNSKLCIKSKQYSDDAVKNSHIKLFEKYGVNANRLSLMQYADSVDDHLSCYSLIDIALDTFPYNGTTTTCEALWMGVPVVTVLGDRHAARVSGSILNAAGLQQLLARDNAEYVEIACDLASNLNYLSDLRGAMRDKLVSSPLLDGRTFTKSLEEKYHKIQSDLISQNRA